MVLWYIIFDSSMRYINLSFLFVFFILGDWTLSEGAHFWGNLCQSPRRLWNLQNNSRCYQQVVLANNNKWVLINVAPGVYT